MLIDYGKRAYIKLSELEKRIDKLEKELEKSAYNTLFFDLTTPEKLTSFNKSIKFISNGDSVVKVELYLSLPTSVTLNYQLNHNGKAVKSGNIFTLESVIAFDLGANDGENILELTASSSVEFEFSLVKITLGGQIEYFSQKRKLSLVTTTYSDYIVYQNGNEATLYSYGENSLVKTFDYTEIFDISLLGFDATRLYIGIVNEQNQLYIETFDIYGEHRINEVPFAKNVSSVCGYLTENGVKVIFSKAGEIYIGDYQNNDSFTCQKTGRKGALVTADASTVGAYIIYGDFRPTKLVDTYATFVLEKGDNYHVYNFDDGYIVYYQVDGRLYKREIGGVTDEPIKLLSCDEIVRLYDGKFVKRVRDTLTVEKEENV